MTQAARERLVADRYSMDAILRHGRAGVVWRATDVVDGNPVAVEEIEPPNESEAERNQRWSRIVQAAQGAAGLEHPGVVKLLDVLLDDQRYFVVTELTEGLALSELLDRHGQLPWRRVARIGLELAEVLESAHHAGVMHGDLQPAHVLVAPDGAVKLAGFGLGPVVPPSRPAPVPAPEQLRGEPVRPAADLWALGATLYAAVEGTSPFPGGPSGILYDGPRPASHAGALAGLLEALLDKAPERRPPAAEARERLREIVEHAAPADPRVTRTTASTITPPFISSAMRTPDASTTVLGPAALSRAGDAVGRAGGAMGRAARAGAAAGRAARGRAGASAAARGWRAAMDWALDPGRRGLVVGLGSTLLALLSFLLIVLLIGNPAGTTGQTEAAAPPVTTAAAPATTAAPPTTATPTTVTPSTVAPVPAGWQVYADERSGYRIAYPASWEVDRDGDQTVEFHDRSTPTILRVRIAQGPVPDPVAAQLQSSQQHAGIHQGSYQQTRLDPSNFQGRPGALLEFTFLGEDEQVFRADELGTNTPPTPGGPGWWVTIFVQSRDADWGVAQSLLRTALDSFVPPSN